MKNALLSKFSEASEMRKIVVLVMVACIAYGQTSGVRTFHNKSEMDGEHSTTLVCFSPGGLDSALGVS